MPIKITPALISHNQFHKGIWLLSVKSPEWYYFMKSENRNTIQNDCFLESVDAPNALEQDKEEIKKSSTSKGSYVYSKMLIL